MLDISVITTLYNYSNYIGYAVKSFLKQTCFAYGITAEMIIVDDASTDNPLKTLQPFLPNERIKYIKLEENAGYSHAKNVGIKNSQAEILVMLDADDILTPDSLYLRFNALQDAYDLVHGPVLDQKSNALKQAQSPLWQQWLKSKKDPSCYKFIHAQSVMLRKDIHRKIGLYDETLRFKSDREMWGRVLNHGFKVGYVNEPVAIYRIHDAQMHKSKEKSLINDKLQKEVLNKIEKRKTDLSDLEMLL